MLQTTPQTSCSCQNYFQEERNPLPSKQQQTQSKFGGKQRKQHTAWFYLNCFSVCPEHIVAFAWPTDFRTSEQNFPFTMQEHPIRKKPKWKEAQDAANTNTYFQLINLPLILNFLKITHTKMSFSTTTQDNQDLILFSAFSILVTSYKVVKKLPSTIAWTQANKLVPHKLTEQSLHFSVVRNRELQKSLALIFWKIK